LFIKQRKQREVRKANETYTQLINQALPIEVQQEVEKERLSREKGSFQLLFFFIKMKLFVVLVNRYIL